MAPEVSLWATRGPRGVGGMAVDRDTDRTENDTTIAALRALTESRVFDEGYQPLATDDALRVAHALSDAGLFVTRHLEFAPTGGRSAAAE